ncbi:hypothetical protein BC941DRAFT_473708 [Chlamydoabsidia padenii]|nr:hypothetical protein BC941DRAFT_473708 [Chlamydoabsidia padenii]
MTSFDTFSEKLPSINMLSQQRQQQQGTDVMYSQDMAYSSFVPQHHTDLYPNVNMNTTDNDMSLDLYNQQNQKHHLSPPLTPSVSSLNMMDPGQFKRKYSVDVGPFGFNAHSSLMHDQDAYRRSSCSAMSVDNCVQHQQDSIHQLEQMIRPNDYQFTDDGTFYDDEMATIDPMANLDNKTSKRKSGQHYQQGPNAPHKHVCKYSYCGWSFKRYEHLKRHMLVHTGERPHVCAFPGCGKSFSRSDNFHAHYRTHTKKQSPDNHQAPPPTRRGSKKANAALDSCMVDSPSSSSSSSSIVSNQDLINATTSSQPFVFNGNKPFDLSYHDMYDQRSFTTDIHNQYSSLTPSQSYLHLEMDSHVGVSSLLNHDQTSSSLFATNGLGTSYDIQGDYSDFQSNPMLPPSPTSSSLAFEGTAKKQRKHRSVATNNNDDSGQQKSHVCPMTQCQRRFKRLEHLKRHMRIHTLERPFACTFPKCHKHFSRSDNLSQHMKTHQNRLQDKRQTTSTTCSSSTSSSPSSSVSPRSVMDDFASPNLINHSYYPTFDSCSTTDVISSLPWTSSSESIGC